MISILSFSETPFSKLRLASYLAAMAAIAALSLAHFGRHATNAAPAPPDRASAPDATNDLLRFGKPSDEVRAQLAEIGIPWFLRRAGVSAQFDANDPRRVTIALTWQGKPVGRYIETIQPIDADRSRLYLAFVPNDIASVRRLAAPIDTTLDPLTLMRATLTEHVRSSIDGGGFRLGILNPDSLQSGMASLLGALAADPERTTDDFPLSGADRDAAAIRRAYREESKRAGAAAAQL